MSINRCPLTDFNSKPLDVKNFKYGIPTPGKNNDCSASNYISVNTIDLEQLVASPPHFFVTPAATKITDTVTIDDSLYDLIAENLADGSIDGIIDVTDHQPENGKYSSIYLMFLKSISINFLDKIPSILN